MRWDYRLISSDGTWSGNIFDFYFKIINRITDDLNVPFRTIDGIRQEDTRAHEAIRETVANAVIHADYSLSRGIVIEKGKTYFKFANPGTLRVSREEVVKGGVSDPRNENIFKMFNLLGVGERAGSGLENIHLACKEQKWTVPDLEESYDTDRVTLKLKAVSILPEESIEKLKSILKNKFKTLSQEEVMALVAAMQEDSVTNNRLQQLLDTHTVKCNKILSLLVDKGLLETEGFGRGTKYALTSLFDTDIDSNEDKDCISKTEVLDIPLNDDEIQVISYLEKNKFINNSMYRKELGFSKDRALRTCNRLVQKDKVVKTGARAKTGYILIER